jgi:hypothetical protein
MQEASNHQRFTQSLKLFSERLDELLTEIRRFEPHLTPVELLDEIASILGELVLVFTEYRSNDWVTGFTQRATSDAQHLRDALRSGNLQSERLPQAICALCEEIGSVIHEDKQTA